MRSTVMMMLVGVMSTGVVLAQGESTRKEGPSSMQGLISERIESFMAALKITRGSEKLLPDRRRGGLSKDNLKNIGALQVRLTKERDRGTNGGEQLLEFLDDNKTRKGSALIIYELSEQTAQSALFKKLVMNSLPLDVVVAQYALKKDGPGDLCLVEKSFDKVKNKFVVNESVIHVVRGNVAMSIHVEDPSLRAEDIARGLDKKLVDEFK